MSLALLAALLGGLPAVVDGRPVLADGGLAATGFETTGFDLYVVRDRLGRDVFYFLEKPGPTPLPLAVVVQGSGCDSQWVKKGDQISGRFQNLVRSVGRGRVRTMVVEKPGVPLLFTSKNPGTAIDCPRAFAEEHTLPRWTEAIAAAIDHALSRPGTDSKKLLVIGHSEGGIVAASVAAAHPAVSHVASLASNGPTQLYDFVLLDGDNGERVYREWATVQADPMSAEKLWRGHPHRRWSTFMGTSLLEQLLKSKAKVFIAHGTADTAVPIVAFDMLKAELTARGRAPAAFRVEKADHGFNGGSLPKGGLPPIAEVFRQVIDWFARP